MVIISIIISFEPVISSDHNLTTHWLNFLLSLLWVGVENNTFHGGVGPDWYNLMMHWNGFHGLVYDFLKNGG